MHGHCMAPSPLPSRALPASNAQPSLHRLTQMSTATPCAPLLASSWSELANQVAPANVNAPSALTCVRGMSRGSAHGHACVLGGSMGPAWRLRTRRAHGPTDRVQGQHDHDGDALLLGKHLCVRVNKLTCSPGLLLGRWPRGSSAAGNPGKLAGSSVAAPRLTLSNTMRGKLDALPVVLKSSPSCCGWPGEPPRVRGQALAGLASRVTPTTPHHSTPHHNTPQHTSLSNLVPAKIIV